MDEQRIFKGLDVSFALAGQDVKRSIDDFKRTAEKVSAGMKEVLDKQYKPFGLPVIALGWSAANECEVVNLRCLPYKPKKSKHRKYRMKYR
jgi:hypothetical protein